MSTTSSNANTPGGSPSPGYTKPALPVTQADRDALCPAGRELHYDKNELYEAGVLPMVQQLFTALRAAGIPALFVAQPSLFYVSEGNSIAALDVHPHFETGATAPSFLAALDAITAGTHLDTGAAPAEGAGAPHVDRDSLALTMLASVLADDAARAVAFGALVWATGETVGGMPSTVFDEEQISLGRERLNAITEGLYDQTRGGAFLRPLGGVPPSETASVGRLLAGVGAAFEISRAILMHDLGKKGGAGEGGADAAG